MTRTFYTIIFFSIVVYIKFKGIFFMKIIFDSLFINFTLNYIKTHFDIHKNSFTTFLLDIRSFYPI